MKNVGAKANILTASEELRSTLGAAGSNQHYPASQVLFHEDGKCAGVYLVCKGKVRMSVKDLPNLDRDFTAGSLLGLPSTFTGRPYSLSAVALVASDVVYVPSRDFLEFDARAPRSLPGSHRYPGARGNVHPVSAGRTPPSTRRCRLKSAIGNFTSGFDRRQDALSSSAGNAPPPAPLHLRRAPRRPPQHRHEPW